MNPLQGSSFYDSLNRMIVGVLVSLCIFLVPTQKDIGFYNKELTIPLYIIGCFTLGIFFSQISDYLAGKNYRCLKCIYYKNNLNAIVEIAQKNQVPFKDENILEAYYDRYYLVQIAGLLGNIPPQEALSAYMLNLSSLSLLYILIGIGYASYFSNCQYLVLTLLSVIILIASIISRKYIEHNIYYSIIRAYKFLN